jgi:hypothetical protein
MMLGGGVHLTIAGHVTDRSATSNLPERITITIVVAAQKLPPLLCILDYFQRLVHVAKQVFCMIRS